MGKLVKLGFCSDKELVCGCIQTLRAKGFNVEGTPIDFAYTVMLVTVL